MSQHAYDTEFAKAQQQISQLQNSLALLGYDAICLAGQILRKESAYVVMSDAGTAAFAAELRSTIRKLEHLEICLPR